MYDCVYFVYLRLQIEIKLILDKRYHRNYIQIPLQQVNEIISQNSDYSCTSGEGFVGSDTAEPSPVATSVDSTSAF